MRTLTLFALFLAAPAMASERDMRFDVFLDDKLIGEHSFDFERDGENLVLDSRASFDVKFLFVTAFKYRHQNREVWRDGCLVEIDATTDSNGKIFDVQGSYQDDALVVGSGPDAATLDGCIKTFAYWNPRIIEAQQLLNAQTGDYEDVALEDQGVETVTIDDVGVPARRYRLTTRTGDIFLWYTDDHQWVALDAPAKGERRIRYLLSDTSYLQDVTASRS